MGSAEASQPALRPARCPLHLESTGDAPRAASSQGHKLGTTSSLWGSANSCGGAFIRPRRVEPVVRKEERGDKSKEGWGGNHTDRKGKRKDGKQSEKGKRREKERASGQELTRSHAREREVNRQSEGKGLGRGARMRDPQSWLGNLGSEKRERLEGLRHATRRARVFGALQCRIDIRYPVPVAVGGRSSRASWPLPPARTPSRQAGQPVCRQRSRPG